MCFGSVHNKAWSVLGFEMVVDEAAFCQYAMASAASPIRFLCACSIMVD